MKPEQPNNSPEKVNATGAVRRLRDALHLVGRDYVDSRLAIQEFVESEFAVDAAFSDRYIARLENERILPTDVTYDADADCALESYRQSMYSYWIPLYRETHTSTEFADWLPDALDIVFPASGRHSRILCDTGVQDPEELSIYSLACPTSTNCPVKVVTGDVLLDTPFLSYEDMEMMQYEQKACDPVRLRTDGHSLLVALYDKRIITADQMLVAKNRYSQVYAGLGS